MLRDRYFNSGQEQKEDFRFFDAQVLTDGEILLMLDKTVPGSLAEKWLPSYHFTICDREGHRAGRCDLRIGYSEGVYYGTSATGWRSPTGGTITRARPAACYSTWPGGTGWTIWSSPAIRTTTPPGRPANMREGFWGKSQISRRTMTCGGMGRRGNASMNLRYRGMLLRTLWCPPF